MLVEFNRLLSIFIFFSQKTEIVPISHQTYEMNNFCAIKTNATIKQIRNTSIKIPDELVK